jgi:hypothetical protein
MNAELPYPSLKRLMALAWSLSSVALISAAAAPGPEPIVPEGGLSPGPYPNFSVTGANWVARGGTEFNGNVEMDLEENGPIPWSITRYNRGDFAVRLSPRDPIAARSNLGQGFTEVQNALASEAPGQAWAPHHARGILLATARQNGPITWPDGEGPFFPTIAAATGSTGNGFDMITGNFDNGDSDITTGKAGAVGEGNFNFATAWFPYDQGWLGGDAAGPDPDGISSWTSPNAHAAGLSANLVEWIDLIEGSGLFGGLARLRLPGVNTLEDGMVFTISTDGASDVNIVGVAPDEDGNSWLVTIREDAAIHPEDLASANQSEFEFLYVPFNTRNLIGGLVEGASGAKRNSVGEFTINRTFTGTYELTIPGKTGADGLLILQVADLEPNTFPPMASRAFLSYEFKDGKFIIQSRKTVSDTAADLADASFYFAWVDFSTPLVPPEGPRMRSLPTVVVSGEFTNSRETSLALSTHEPEVLVTYVDAINADGLTDPITNVPATAVMLGRFYDAITLTPTSDPFPIFGSPVGALARNAVDYNPVSKQYVVVANARNYNDLGKHVVLIALVNPQSAGDGNRVAKAFIHDPATPENYDDVAVAVSQANGNFLLVAERAFPEEGEGTIGALYNSEGELLTALYTRLDLLQSVGDEDDPDVIYLPGLDVFLYVSNTDNSNGSTGTLSNRIVGSIVETIPDAGGRLVVRTEQVLSDGAPEGRPEGHPASLLNPFNGQLITAYDAGNNTSLGDLSFFNLGSPPDYVFTEAQPEVPYLAGPAPGVPFRHQHPQLAADPDRGVIVLGFNAVGSTIGLPPAYAFLVLGPDGQPLPSQFGAPYFLAAAPGGIDNGANNHIIKYSPTAGQFLVSFRSGNQSWLTGLQITSSHLEMTLPALSAALHGNTVTLSWPAGAEGFQLESSGSITPADWKAVDLNPTRDGDLNKVEVTPTLSAEFYRLRKP